jgi:predicted nucleic acid-binding protein
MDSDRADFFEPAIQDVESLIVPSIIIHEVFKILKRQLSETVAVDVLAYMQRGRVIEMSDQIAILAAKMAVDLGLPTADSIIYATAYIYEATVWTQDADFKNLGGVKYFEKA